MPKSFKWRFIKKNQSWSKTFLLSKAKNSPLKKPLKNRNT